MNPKIIINYLKHHVLTIVLTVCVATVLVTVFFLFNPPEASYLVVGTGLMLLWSISPFIERFRWFCVYRVSIPLIILLIVSLVMLYGNSKYHFASILMLFFLLPFTTFQIIEHFPLISSGKSFLYDKRKSFVYAALLTSIIIYVVENQYPPIHLMIVVLTVFSLQIVVFWLNGHWLQIKRRRLEQNLASLVQLKNGQDQTTLTNTNNELVITTMKLSELDTKLIKTLQAWLHYSLTPQQVSAETELRQLQHFIELQNLRFETAVSIRFDCDVNIPALIRNIRIPSLTFTTLVAIAYINGVEQLTPWPFIKIEMSCNHQRLLFRVQFNAANYKASSLIAEQLKPLIQQLDTLYPNQYGLTMRSEDHLHILRFELATMQSL